MSNKFDLIVVGLGPAGAALLYSASRNGLKTLGIDKRREIGVPIQCGEFIPDYKEFNNLLPETDEKYKEIFRKIPSKLILNRTDKVRLYTPSNDEYEVDFKGLVIDRERFDKWLVSQGIKYGGEVWIKTQAYKLEEDGAVYLKSPKGNTKVVGKVVAIATGASSPLLDYAGLYREINEYNLGHVIQRVMAGVDVEPSVIEMYTGKYYSPGAYGWIIPRGDSIANVGVGIRYPYADKRVGLEEYLERFIHKHPIASFKLKNSSSLSIVGGIVPVGPPAHKTVSGRFISLGDAANHVIASLGAGIVTSVIAGLIAGDAVTEHLHNNETLFLYEKLWRKNIGRVLEDGYNLRLAIDVLTRSDKLIDYGMKIIGKKYLRNLVYTHSPKKVNLVSLLERVARNL